VTFKFHIKVETQQRWPLGPDDSRRLATHTYAPKSSSVAGSNLYTQLLM